MADSEPMPNQAVTAKLSRLSSSRFCTLRHAIKSSARKLHQYVEPRQDSRMDTIIVSNDYVGYVITAERLECRVRIAVY